MPTIRPRYWFFAILLISVIFLDAATDPDTGFITSIPYGVSIFNYLIMLGRGLLAVIALQWAVKFIFDRPEYQFHTIIQQHADAGKWFMVTAGLFAIAFAIVIHAVVAL